MNKWWDLTGSYTMFIGDLLCVLLCPAPEQSLRFEQYVVQ
jgi:hypothetical protein